MQLDGVPAAVRNNPVKEHERNPTSYFRSQSQLGAAEGAETRAACEAACVKAWYWQLGSIEYGSKFVWCFQISYYELYVIVLLCTEYICKDHGQWPIQDYITE